LEKSLDVSFTIEAKEAAAGYDCCFNFLVALPTIHTTVGLDDSGKKLIQYRFLTSEVTMFEMMLLELLLEAWDKPIHLLAHRN
jgi:hypothetical protein